MKIVLSLILLPLQLFGQEFTGIWTGFLLKKESRLPYELVISGEKDNLSGYSLTVFIIGDVENTGIKTIKIKNKKSSIAIEDDELIYNDYKTPSKKVTLYAKLSFEEGSATVLQGTFFTRSADRTSYNGTIRVEKKDELTKTKLMAQLEKMNLINELSFRKHNVNEPKSSATAGNEIAKEPSASTPAAISEEIKITVITKEPPVAVSLPYQKKPGLTTTLSLSPLPVNSIAIKAFKAAEDLASRKTEVIRNIYFRSDSLVLSLYDNGEIDGDTVSVLVNNNVVIAREGLSTNAIKTIIYTPAAFVDSLQVIMYAENLGSIAPNTGLLIVEDGTERHQLRFEGDFQKNSSVIFRRKK